MAAKKSSPLKIIPLGGLDGIGKNMTVFECGDDMVLVDAGLMFPDDSQPGIDLVLPDYTYVLENEEKLRGIIVTHGHEDHTGSLPYLLQDLNNKVPIFSSKLTLGFIEGKLSEFRIRAPKFREVKGGSHVNLGGISLDFFSMTHSIPGALGVFIRTNQGTVMHTGDFKLDQTPIDGVTPDYAAISRFAKQGIDLLLSDSTNATVPGFTKSEAEVGPNLLHAIKNAPGRVFVASFSSHIHRLQQICDAARKCGRKVVVTGRSMLTNTRVARELGYLNIDDADIIDAFDIDNLPDDKIVVMCTGSQGEPLSALSRMANGEHKTLSIHEGDTVILSATPVPGNEKAVQQVVNSLAKLGCDVWDKNRALVHVSGHGSQEELKLLMAMAKPTYFMPVHGEAVHLRAHAQLARKMGIKDDHIFILDNGDTLEMRGGIVKRGTPVESGVVYVDGLRIGDTDPIVLRDRQKLANDGMVTAVAIVSLKHKKIEAIEFSGRGVSFAIDDQFSEDASASIMKTIEKGKFSFTSSGSDAVRKAVRDSLSNFIWSRTRTRPMIIPVVMEAVSYTHLDVYKRQCLTSGGGRFVPWQRAPANPADAWLRAASCSVRSICCLHMDGHSTWFPRPSLWRRRSALRPITRRLAPQARSPRSHACARSRTPRTRLPLPLRNGRLPWSAAGSTLRIWIYLWRHMSLSCCRTLAIDQIFRPACCAETPCCRIFHHRRAGSCADRARRAFRVPSWYRLVRSHGFAPSCP